MILAQASNDNSGHSNINSESNSGEGPERITVEGNRPTPSSAPRGGRDSHGSNPQSKPQSKPTRYTLVDVAGLVDKDKDVFTNLVNTLLSEQTAEKFDLERIQKLNKVLDRISAVFKMYDLGTTFDNGNYKDLFQKSTTLLISSSLTQLGIVLGATAAGSVVAVAGLSYAIFDIVTPDNQVLSDKVHDWATSGGIRLKSPTWDNYMGVAPY